MNEPAVSWGGKPYYSLDSYLKETYGEKIYKIALDANMTCPNRDGSLDTRGCIFCGHGGSGDFAAKQAGSIKEQLALGKSYFKGKKIGTRFIAYFQSFTNTYAPVPYLKGIFTDALSEDDVAGISIATRPDCLSDEILTLLASLQQLFPQKFIWIELGLQTIHERTARYIRRGYPLSCYENALKKLQEIGILVITHVILGLPFETKEDMLHTIRYLNAQPTWGIKLQLLHVLKDTDLAVDYANGLFPVLSLNEYIDILISCLTELSSDTVIHRITGDGPKNSCIAPTWSLNKRNVLNTLHKEMKSQNKWQGENYHATRLIDSL